MQGYSRSVLADDPEGPEDGASPTPARRAAPRATSSAAIGEAGAERLSFGVIWAFSFPAVAFGIMSLLFGTYLMKFATDVLLIAPAAMGTIIAASRLWDAVSDPLAGYLSDRTRSRLGRRRAWMFASRARSGMSTRARRSRFSTMTASPCQSG